jgi:transcriptional regulator GlxA family with amidase domain
MTPYAYLRLKRTTVARRLLLATNWTQNRIASRVGFVNRATMFRNLRRLTGQGSRAIRGIRAGPEPARAD